MKYSEGYKYQLKANIVIQTTLRPDTPCVINGFIYLDTDGLLYIYKGYAWDGCSFAPDWRFISSFKPGCLIQSGGVRQI